MSFICMCLSMADLSECQAFRVNELLWMSHNVLAGFLDDQTYRQEQDHPTAPTTPSLGSQSKILPTMVSRKINHNFFFFDQD